MHHPLVSVIMPSYNQGRFIEAAINSIHAQTYSHIEFGVLDGGSTDNTLDVINSYGGAVRYRSRPDFGQVAAINEGLATSRGEIVGWLCSDDELAPEAVECAVEMFRRNPAAGVAFGDTIFVTESDAFAGRSYADNGWDTRRVIDTCRNPIPQPSAFFRRAAIEGAGALDPAYRYFFDFDLFLRISRRWPIVHLPVVMSYYRLHSTSLTSNSAPYVWELASIYRKLGVWRPKALSAMYARTAEYYGHGGMHWKAFVARVRSKLWSIV